MNHFIAVTLCLALFTAANASADPKKKTKSKPKTEPPSLTATDPKNGLIVYKENKPIPKGDTATKSILFSIKLSNCKPEKLPGMPKDGRCTMIMDCTLRAETTTASQESGLGSDIQIESSSLTMGGASIKATCPMKGEACQTADACIADPKTELAKEAILKEYNTAVETQKKQDSQKKDVQ